jgi:hypothetical protein
VKTWRAVIVWPARNVHPVRMAIIALSWKIRHRVTVHAPGTGENLRNVVESLLRRRRRYRSHKRGHRANNNGSHQFMPAAALIAARMRV